MIDGKFLKRIQSAVNRNPNIAGTERKVSIPQVREYVISAWSHAEPKDEPMIVREIVEMIQSGESVLEIVKPSQLGEIERTNAIDPVEGTGTLSLVTPSSAIAPSQQSASQLDLKTEIAQTLRNQDVNEDLLDFLLNDTVNSALSLKEGLSKVRQTEQALIGKVLSDHAQSVSLQRDSVMNTLDNRKEEQSQRLGKSQTDLNTKLKETLTSFGIL